MSKRKKEEASRRHMSHCWFMCLLAEEVETREKKNEKLAKRT
jgi:hypothetical protein